MVGRQPGFRDVEARLRELSAQGDPLEELAATVDFEMFRPDLAAPRQRNTEAEKAAIKEGRRADEIWADKPAKARQKDVDARWTVKLSKGKPMPKGTARANAAKSAVRAHVEHPFAHQKGPMRLVIRTIGLARAKATVILANIAYNMKRWCWLDRRSVPA